MISAASRTVRTAHHDARPQAATNEAFQASRGTRVRRARTGGVAHAVGPRGEHGPQVSPGADHEHDAHCHEHLRLELGRSPPPERPGTDEDPKDDHHGECRPDPQRRQEEQGERQGERGRGPPANGEPDQDRPDEGRGRVAGPGGQHPPGATGRTDGHGVADMSPRSTKPVKRRPQRMPTPRGPAREPGSPRDRAPAETAGTATATRAADEDEQHRVPERATPSSGSTRTHTPSTHSMGVNLAAGRGTAAHPRTALPAGGRHAPVASSGVTGLLDIHCHGAAGAELGSSRDASRHALGAPRQGGGERGGGEPRLGPARRAGGAGRRAGEPGRERRAGRHPPRRALPVARPARGARSRRPARP